MCTKAEPKSACSHPIPAVTTCASLCDFHQRPCLFHLSCAFSVLFCGSALSSSSILASRAARNPPREAQVYYTEREGTDGNLKSGRYDGKIISNVSSFVLWSSHWHLRRWVKLRARANLANGAPFSSKALWRIGRTFWICQVRARPKSDALKRIDSDVPMQTHVHLTDLVASAQASGVSMELWGCGVKGSFWLRRGAVDMRACLPANSFWSYW